MQKFRDAVTGRHIQPRLRIYAEGEVILGWGKIMLLRHVRDTGSIAEAARCMGISYNHAWRLIRLMNASFKKPLVLAARGGGEAGGASVSPTGEKVLLLYEEMAQACLSATTGQWRSLRALLCAPGQNSQVQAKKRAPKIMPSLEQ